MTFDIDAFKLRFFQQVILGKSEEYICRWQKYYCAHCVAML